MALNVSSTYDPGFSQGAEGPAANAAQRRLSVKCPLPFGMEMALPSS